MEKRFHQIFILLCAWVLITSSAAFCSETASAPNLSFNSPYLHPGKLDLLFSFEPNSQDHLNFMWWSPSFKGGGGRFEQNGSSTSYFGGFFNPFVNKRYLGELIVGVQAVKGNAGRDKELQAEYRMPSGFGVGAGFVDLQSNGKEVKFGKLSYRQETDSKGYIMSVQLQEQFGETSTGGYLALYDERFSAIGGYDGEQWRGLFGFIAQSDIEETYRPALEILYVDNSIGAIPGPKFTFVNATLGYRGGFLSLPAKLGRGMGPTGLEFGNPLGFLQPTFNRRLDVWELGQLANFRLVRQVFKDGSKIESWEALMYPSQFMKSSTSIFDGVFVGMQFDLKNRGDDGKSVWLGYYGKAGAFNAAVRLSYDFERNDSGVFLGLIDYF